MQTRATRRYEAGGRRRDRSAVPSRRPGSARASSASKSTIAGRRGRRRPSRAQVRGRRLIQRALDGELRALGIRATNVCPGGVATEFALAEGYGRPQDALEGMMIGEDVAEVVLFVLTRPRGDADTRDGLPADEGGVVGLAVKWGIISTADINRKVIPGAKESPKVDLVAVASRDQARADAYATRVGDRARVRLVRGAARRPRDRGRLHLAPEHDALRVVDPRARGGQARALREAALAPPRRGRGGVRRRRPRRPAAQRGVHVPPQPADEALQRARRRGRDRRAPARPLARSATRSTTRTTSGCAPTSRAAR